MLKVPYGQDPYSVIGKYIRDHITAIEDIIAVIKINEVETNQLFMVDMNEENYFIWENDWYEGEKDVALIDFFPVSEAINPSAHPEPCEDAVSRKLMYELGATCMARRDENGELVALGSLDALPSAQPYTDEEIQKMQDLEQAQFDTMYELGKQAAEPHWIPCSERLPEVNESVLVTTEWNDISIAWRIGIDEWFIHEGSTNATTDDLAAWMPLPEPWRGEEQ